MQILRAQGVGMNDPLVTSDGFPRSDVDLYTVRLTRQNINRLRNDLQSKMVK